MRNETNPLSHGRHRHCHCHRHRHRHPPAPPPWPATIAASSPNIPHRRRRSLDGRREPSHLIYQLVRVVRFSMAEEAGKYTGKYTIKNPKSFGHCKAQPLSGGVTLEARNISSRGGHPPCPRATDCGSRSRRCSTCARAGEDDVCA